MSTTQTPPLTPVPREIAFDPFEHSPVMKRLRDAKIRTIVGIIVLGVASVIVAALIGGHVGTPSDFQPIQDAQRLMDVGSPPASPADFPLLRDVVSWYLIAMSAATLWLVRYQWRLITDIVPHLAKAGVIFWRLRVAGDARSRAMLVGTANASAGPDVFLNLALARAQRLLAWASRWWLAVFVVAFGVAVGYIAGEVDGRFVALAPTHLTSVQEHHWLTSAGNSWWAGRDNLPGLFVAFVITWLMFVAIFAQNLVGFVAIYLFAAMGRTLEFRCDWVNHDRRFGWAPVGTLYRTMIGSLMLHIGALTSVLWLMGFGRWAYMSVLILIPIFAIPMYVVVPTFVFMRFSHVEKSRYHDEQAALADQDPDDLALRQRVRNEQEFARKAVINPVRPRKRDIPASVVTIIIPVMLTAVQVIAAIKS
jgi:hypothetical protein